MALISITRLRVRSIRFLPAFALHVLRSRRQVRRAPGFQGGSLLLDWRWAFWTMTAWDTLENLRRYMSTGAHRTVMPYLLAARAGLVRSEAVLVCWGLMGQGGGHAHNVVR